MSTFREAIYMVLDLIKSDSDDAFYTEDHVAYLLDKYRAYILTVKANESPTGDVADSNYQAIELELEKYIPVNGCTDYGYYLRSKTEIPESLDISNVKLYAPDNFMGRFSFVSPERFTYVNSSRWTKDFIYACIGDDNKVYLKSTNPQTYYIQKINVRAMFESALDIAKENAKNGCNSYLDEEFPLQADLFGLLLDYVVKVLTQSAYRPEDNSNNAHDDLEGLAVKNVNTK